MNADKSITFTSKTNFYGTATLQYTLTDNNGTSGIAKITIKRGTDAQIKTAEILNKYVSPNKDIATVLYLYSIDGDTTRVYGPNYNGGEIIYYTFFTSDKIGIRSVSSLVPEIGNYTYTIVNDGNVLTNANVDNSPVLLTNITDFTDSAKKLDMSGYMTVSGISLQYGGKILVYTNQVQ